MIAGITQEEEVCRCETPGTRLPWSLRPFLRVNKLNQTGGPTLPIPTESGIKPTVLTVQKRLINRLATAFTSQTV